MNEEEKIKLRERLLVSLLHTGKPPEEAMTAAEKVYRWIMEGPPNKNTE